MLTAADRAAIRKVLHLCPIVAEIQRDLDHRNGPPLSVSVFDALYAIIAAAGRGAGDAARLDRSSGHLRALHSQEPEEHPAPEGLLVGNTGEHLLGEDRRIEIRKHYRRVRRTLEAVGSWCNSVTDGERNYDRLAYTLLMASVPVAARAYDCRAVDSAGVQAAYRSNGATKVRSRLRQATARIRTYTNADERTKTEKKLFGFGLHAMGRFDETGKDKTLWVSMIRLTPGSTSETKVAAEMLRATAALGEPVLNLFVGDRAYSNSPPLRSLIHDMHGDLVADLNNHHQRPFRRPDGTWLWGGGIFDPAIPPGRLDRNRRTINQPLVPWLEKTERELDVYRLAEHSQPDIYGRHRFIGNCVRYGVDCPLRPDLSRPGSATYQTGPAGGAVDLCQGKTLQLDRDDYEIPKAKDAAGTIPTYQPFAYGTWEHAALYYPWRSRTEGLLGTLTEHHGMWGGRHGFKVRNFDILQLLTLAAGVAYNLKRRGYFPSDHGTEDRKKEAVLVLPFERAQGLSRKLASRRRMRERFDPTRCKLHQHPAPSRPLNAEDTGDPPAA